MKKLAKFESYKFAGKVWKHKGQAAWHFVTLPKKLSTEIRKNHEISEEGWGRLKALARVGKSQWQTAIWFDTKHKSYLLPIKASVRKTENISDDSQVAVELQLEVESQRLKRFIRTPYTVLTRSSRKK